jgi:alpha-glucosidase (family GH31 glycosyl hydrolase)
VCGCWKCQRAGERFEDYSTLISASRLYRSSSFELYEDDGVSRDYEKGIYSTISFLWDNANSTLTIGERQGSFAGMLLV